MQIDIDSDVLVHGQVEFCAKSMCGALIQGGDPYYFNEHDDCGDWYFCSEQCCEDFYHAANSMKGEDADG